MTERGRGKGFSALVRERLSNLFDSGVGKNRVVTAELSGDGTTVQIAHGRFEGPVHNITLSNVDGESVKPLQSGS